MSEDSHMDQGKIMLDHFILHTYFATSDVNFVLSMFMDIYGYVCEANTSRSVMDHDFLAGIPGDLAISKCFASERII